jgi:hypothetical protein
MGRFFILDDQHLRRFADALFLEHSGQTLPIDALGKEFRGSQVDRGVPHGGIVVDHQHSGCPSARGWRTVHWL